MVHMSHQPRNPSVVCLLERILYGLCMELYLYVQSNNHFKPKTVIINPNNFIETIMLISY